MTGQAAEFFVDQRDQPLQRLGVSLSPFGQKRGYTLLTHGSLHPCLSLTESRGPIRPISAHVFHGADLMKILWLLVAGVSVWGQNLYYLPFAADGGSADG